MTQPMTEPRHPHPEHDMQGAHLALALQHHWPLVSTLWLLLAIPGIPAILLVSLLLFGPAESTLFMSLINPLYIASPWAVLVHGSSSAIFFLTMPWQFSPAIRHKHPGWHKVSGRLVLLSAYTMAFSGIWMHLFLTPAELGMRFIGLLVVSCGMVLAFSMAFYAVLHGQLDCHRRWMCRAVAITLAVVTPLFVEEVAALTLGQVAVLKPLLAPFLYKYDRLIGLALNLLIVEWLLRKKFRADSTARGT